MGGWIDGWEGGLDCVPGLRSADVQHSMIWVRPAPRRSPTSPLLRGSLSVQPRSRNRTSIASAESSTPGKRLSPQTSLMVTLIYGLTIDQWSQINEDTVEPSLAAQDFNPVAYASDLIFAPCVGFVPGSVQLIRPVRVLSLVVAHSTADQIGSPTQGITD